MIRCVLLLALLALAGPSLAGAPSPSRCTGWSPIPEAWRGTVAEYCHQQGPECVVIEGRRCDGGKLPLALEYGRYQVRGCDTLPQVRAAKRVEYVIWASLRCGKPNEVAPAPAPTAPTAPNMPLAEADCKASNGRWMGTVQGRGRLTGCLMPTKDAGKACTDSSQCQSACLATGPGVGKCHEWSAYRGCGILITRDGGSQVQCLE